MKRLNEHQSSLSNGTIVARKGLTIAGFLLLVTAVSLNAESIPEPNVIFQSESQTVSSPQPGSVAVGPLFESDQILNLQLAFDIPIVLRDVTEDRQEHPAVLSFIDETGSQVDLEVTVKTRGHFRRDRRNCAFPPLRIDFNKDRFPADQLSGTPFENQNKLKLVCHCQNNSENHEQFVLKEYLAYRAYGLLTEISYAVRLVRITYVDISGQRDSHIHFAFFIEDEDKMAERNGGVVLDSTGIRQTDIDDSQATLFSVFQYLIGNTDWKISALHNVTLLDDGRGFPIAVPYDFDWAGAVDPPYAEPHPDLGTRNVRQRVFISPCRTEYDLRNILDLFIERRPLIYALYTGLEVLNEDTRESALSYLNSFYEVLSDSESARREFERNCPGF